MSKGSKRRPQSITDEEFEQRWDWVFGDKEYPDFKFKDEEIGNFSEDFKPIKQTLGDGIPGENEIVFHAQGEEVLRFTQDGKFYCMGEELQTAGEVYEVLKNWASYTRVD